MPRLTLVTQAAQRPPPCPIQEMQEILADLHAARDGTTDGPTVLWLINDLMSCCENRFEDDEIEYAGSRPAAHFRQNFLSRLTGFAEDIRRSNGELSDEFFAFLRTTPAAMGDYTSN